MAKAFVVIGENRTSGERVRIVLLAVDADEARRLAGQCGLHSIVIEEAPAQDDRGNGGEG